LRFYGAADETAIAEILGDEAQDGGKFEVWPENCRTLNLFLECQTQWVAVAGLGGIAYLGLVWASVDALLRRERVKRARQVFADLRLMERAALPLLNEQRTDD